jgi:elongation factor Ts
MPTIVETIKQLRQETGAGVLDCRKALEAAGGDYNLALVELREQAAAEAARRAERPATQGRVELYAHGGGRIGVMVEVNAETDFTARSQAFCAFTHELALQIAAAAPLYIRDEDIPAEVLREETLKAQERARAEGKPEHLLARIVEGMLDKYKDHTVLLRQLSIRDEKTRIEHMLSQLCAAVGENIRIRRFARWEIGEDAAGI